MFLVARRSAWCPGRGGCEENQFSALRLPWLEICQREGAASEKNPLQPVLGDSPADLRATYPPPLLVGVFDIVQQRNGYGEAQSAACRAGVCEAILYFAE